MGAPKFSERAAANERESTRLRGSSGGGTEGGRVLQKGKPAQRGVSHRTRMAQSGGRADEGCVRVGVLY